MDQNIKHIALFCLIMLFLNGRSATEQFPTENYLKVHTVYGWIASGRNQPWITIEGNRQTKNIIYPQVIF